MSKEDFKNFVKKNPKLANYVNNGTMSWQKFYEMFDMYGEQNEVWNQYIQTTSVTGFLSWLKTINLDEIQSGVNSLQRVVGVFQDMQTKDEKPSYKPRPKYKQFDD